MVAVDTAVRDALAAPPVEIPLDGSHGDPGARDQRLDASPVDAMRPVLGTVRMNGVVVIGRRDHCSRYLGFGGFGDKNQGIPDARSTRCRGRPGERVRFLLDHDVDARLARVFKARGHQGWTVGEANLALASDDELTVYANDRGAVLVTHDVPFSQRRARNVIGKHLQLRCEEPDAIALLTQHFDAVVRSLGVAEHVFVKVSAEGCSTSMKWN